MCTLYINYSIYALYSVLKSSIKEKWTYYNLKSTSSYSYSKSRLDYLLIGLFLRKLGDQISGLFHLFPQVAFSHNSIYSWTNNFSGFYLSLLLLLLLFSLTHMMQRKHCFWNKFLKLKFWWICTFLDPLYPKITFLEFGLCVCPLSA